MEETPNHWIDRIRTVHPGHVILGVSLPFCYQAYSDYTKHHASLDVLAQPIVRHYPDGYNNDSARRAVGVAVASRALRIATAGSIGVFGVCLAATLYATRCDTMETAVQNTTDWAHNLRTALDDTFHIQRIDRHHPEYQANLELSEEEQLQKYFPAKDFEDQEE